METEDATDQPDHPPGSSAAGIISEFEARPADKPTELPASRDLNQLRLATSAMTNRGLTLEQAAGEYGVDPDTLYTWHRTFVNFVGKEVFAATAAGAKERVEIDRETSRKFDRNWAEMLRIWELERPQMSPVRKRLLSSPFTRWMFQGEHVDRITVIGAFAVLAFTALAIKAGMSYRGDDPDDGPGGGAADAELPPVDPSDPESFMGERQGDVLEEVASAIQDFVQLETWQERLSFVRDQDAVKPLMAAYYKTNPDRAFNELVLNSQVSFIQREDGVFALLQGEHQPDDSGLEKSEHVIFLAELRDEEPKVLFDWKVLVNYEPVPWEKFVETKSTQTSRFRMRVATGDYFNQPFMDSEKYSSYALLPLHRERVVYGFAERGSELAKELDTLLSKELNQNRAMILDLSYPEDAKFDNVLKIDSIVSDGWLEE